MVCKLIRKRDTQQKLLERCFGSALGRQFHRAIKGFKGWIHIGRWGTVAFSIPELRAIMGTIRWGWNKDAFLRGEAGGVAGNTTSNLADSVDDAVTSNYWWGWVIMIDQVLLTLRKASAWADSCSCHSDMLAAVKRKELEVTAEVVKRLQSCPMRCRPKAKREARPAKKLDDACSDSEAFEAPGSPSACSSSSDSSSSDSSSSSSDSSSSSSSSKSKKSDSPPDAPQPRPEMPEREELDRGDAGLNTLTPVFDNGVHIGWEMNCHHPLHQKPHRCRVNRRNCAKGRTAQTTKDMLLSWASQGGALLSREAHMDLLKTMEEGIADGSYVVRVGPPVTQFLGPGGRALTPPRKRARK